MRILAGASSSLAFVSATPEMSGYAGFKILNQIHHLTCEYSSDITLIIRDSLSYFIMTSHQNKSI